MPTMENEQLRALYDSLDYHAIKRMVEDKNEEGIHTEFKTFTRDTELVRDDRNNLAKALAGFANASGGIVIWGVETESAPNSPDQAKAERPIANPDAMRVRMETVTVNATEPPVHGVTYRVVTRPDGKGFVLLLIPAADGEPRMAMLGHGRFFRRDPIGHHPMSQSEVGDMFGRRARPFLELLLQGIKCQVTQSNGPTDGYPAQMQLDCELFIGCMNSGRGLARFPGVRFTLQPHGEFIFDTMKHPPKVMTVIPSPTFGPRVIILAGGADSAIHVETDVPAFVITRNIRLERKDGEMAFSDAVSDLTIEYTLSADGVPSKKGMLVVPSADIIKAMSAAKIQNMPIEEWFRLPQNASLVTRTKLNPRR